MSLVMIAGFLIALGVLFVIMAGAQQRPKDRAARKRVAIPPERVQILSLLCFIGGFATLAYAYHTGNVGL